MKQKINLVDIINKKNNDSYRTVINAEEDGYIFDSQINAAKEIVSELARKTTRSHHVLLLAKMQSGKSGVCNAITNILTETKLHIFLGIDKYMYISGMNDCGLKEQTYQRVLDQVIKANIDNVYVGKHSKRNLSPNKFFVMKNSDLLKYEGDINNTILFIDESHYGSNEYNVLTKFLTKYGIDWKNDIDLIKRNIYIVSVSATPFSEIVSDKAECKKMVELKTDDAYIGITNYLSNDLIFDANKDDITDGTIFDYIADAKMRMNNNQVSGVIFIRTRNFDAIKNNDEIMRNYDIVQLESNVKSIDYDNLNNKIEELIEKNEFNNRMRNIKLSNNHQITLANVKPIIVLLKGAYRAGITISPRFKDYIYMVYDYSLKADTTAQALLGRMCGYRDMNSIKNLNTYFYINKQFADMYSDWENDFTNKDKIPFNQTKWVWVDSDYKGTTTIASKSCGNKCIELTDQEITDIHNLLNRKRNKLAIMKNVFPTILEKKGIDIPYDYMEEVIMNGKNNYATSSHKRRFDSFSEDLLVYPFRADKIKDFQEDTQRDYLTQDDLGKKCVSLVLDAEIYPNGEIKGNKRLLVYYAEVAQKARMADRNTMYMKHKDTTLIKSK